MAASRRSAEEKRAAASAILSQPKKPGVVSLADMDEEAQLREIRARASGAALHTYDGLEDEQLRELIRATPHALMSMASERSNAGGEPSPSAKGSKFGARVWSRDPAARDAGGEDQAHSGSEADFTDMAPASLRLLRSRPGADGGNPDSTVTTRGRAPPQGQGKFQVRLDVTQKPGLVMESAGSFSDDDDEPTRQRPQGDHADSSVEMGFVGAAAGGSNRRASVGSTGAEAMAAALEQFGDASVEAQEQAQLARSAYVAHVRAERAVSKRQLAAVAPGSDSDDEAASHGGGAAVTPFHGGRLKDSPVKVDHAGRPDFKSGTSKLGQSGAKDLLVSAGKRVQTANRISKIAPPKLNRVCLLNKNKPMMRAWDVLMIVLLVYTALLTPFEVSFVESAVLDAWFWINRIVDAGFLVDLVFNFFLPYHDPDTRREIINHASIAAHYLQGWFIVDILSIFPFDIVFEQASGNSGAGATFRIVRVIRLLKLAKLLRVVRASRIVTRWRSRVGISFSLVQLVSFLVYVLLLAHWSACAFYLVGTLTMDEAAGITSWVVQEDVLGKPFEAYIASLYFSTMTTTTIGYGDIVPVNAYERLFTVFLMILGGALYAYVIGAIGSIVATFDGATSEHRANMDQLNRYTTELDLPQKLREELREYFSQTLSIQRERYYSHLLTFMSPKLRGHVAMQRHGEWIKHVPFFNVGNTHERIAFVTAVAMELQPAVFGMLERVMYAGQTINRMYIIQKGLATVQGKIVSRGHFFGEEAILTQARAISTVRALTYLDVFYLSKDALSRILDSGDFGETRKKIRYAVIRMALRRELLKCATLARIQNNLFRIGQGGVLAYAPDPSADVELDGDAEDASVFGPSSVRPIRVESKTEMRAGRPPSPPPLGLVTLARQASKHRATRASEASILSKSMVSSRGVVGGGTRIEGTALTGEDETALEAESHGHERASSLAPLSAGAATSAPSFGAGGSKDSKLVPSVVGAPGGSISGRSQKCASSVGPEVVATAAGGEGLQAPTQMLQQQPGFFTAEQRASFAQDARRMERRMPLLAREMSRATLGTRRRGSSSAASGHRSLPPSRLQAPIASQPTAKVGRGSERATSPGAALPSASDVDATVRRPGTADTASSMAPKRATYERAVLQRILVQASKSRADAGEAARSAQSLESTVKAMEVQMDKVFIAAKRSQFVAVFACLLSCALLVIILTRD